MNATPFRRFGVMLDMSRDSVMNVESLKAYTSLLADLGYNTLMLYTEDTYEIPEEPYFGHFRGRYTQEELRDVVDHCQGLGIEVIPCIQTLAHLDAIFRWPHYQKIWDCTNILLADVEETYDFVEKMFASARACFSTRYCHIGMDEAHMVGLGKFLDRFGFEDRFQLLARHLRKVCEIAKKYGFEPLMWGDMFFRLGNHGRYYNAEDPKVPDPAELNLPEDLSIVYWDYYYTNEAHFDTMIRAHQKLERPLWFAGGIWTWLGFAPDNRFSIQHAKAALASCRKQNVENVIFTMWGDNGGECSRWSVLPALYAVSRFAQGEEDEEAIRAGFRERFGLDFDDFCLLDLRRSAEGDAATAVTNPERYLLYNDPFLGILDSTLSGGENEFYFQQSQKLQDLTKNEAFGDLFQTALMLAGTLSVKAELGLRTRKVYADGNPVAAAALIRDYDICINHMKGFLEDFRTQWLRENKPFGLEIHETRLGGMITRLTFCRERLERWMQTGERIPELEEAPLDYQGGGTEMAHRPLRLLRWDKNVSPNLI